MINLKMVHLADGFHHAKVAFGSTLRDCEEELHSTLEDWILVGLKLNHPLPVIAKINLNTTPTYEPVEAV